MTRFSVAVTSNRDRFSTFELYPSRQTCEVLLDDLEYESFYFKHRHSGNELLLTVNEVRINRSAILSASGEDITIEDFIAELGFPEMDRSTPEAYITGLLDALKHPEMRRLLETPEWGFSTDWRY